MRNLTVVREEIASLKEIVRKDGRMELTGDFYYGGATYHYTKAEKEKMTKLEKEEKELAEKYNTECEKKLAEKIEKTKATKEKNVGGKIKANYKRKNTEIENMKKEIELLQKKIANAEMKKMEYAKQYKEETGKEIE